MDMVKDVHGCVIRNCKIVQCHGGITVSRQGQIRVEHTEFNDVQYGIRCLQNAKVAILENEIHHCSTSGIFMRLAAHGLIAGNYYKVDQFVLLITFYESHIGQLLVL